MVALAVVGLYAPTLGSLLGWMLCRGVWLLDIVDGCCLLSVIMNGCCCSLVIMDGCCLLSVIMDGCCWLPVIMDGCCWLPVIMAPLSLPLRAVLQQGLELPSVVLPMGYPCPALPLMEVAG
jgi:hypothetical protein